MLPKRERITKNREIKGILKRKRIHFSSPLLYVAGEENQETCSRLAVVCSSRLGGAVVRNKTKRAILAAYSRIRYNLAKNCDFVILARSSGHAVKEYLADLSKICAI